jgi:hypothetical protein
VKEEHSTSVVLGWIDSVVLIVSAAVSVAYAITKTPPSFWISAWVVQGVTFAVVITTGRNGGHWPSTVFGILELAYIFSLLVMLSSRDVSFDGLAHMFFGLLFVHGILYLIAAKPFFIRRGYIKPTNT